VNVLLYALAAVAAGILAIRVPLDDRSDPVRRAFSRLCTVLGASYLGFTLYLLPGLGFFKYVHSFATAFLPLALLDFVERFFGRDAPHRARRAQLALITPIVAVLFPVLDFVLYRNVPRASVAEVVFGVFVFGAFLLPIRRLYALYASTTLRVDRARIRYFIALVGLAIGFSAVEALSRAVGTLPDGDLSVLERPVLLQGALPPLGAIFASIFIYFLHQILTVHRLLDLAEIFSRMASVAIAGSLLVGVEALSVGTLIGAYPIHGAFQVFLAACLFLLAWDPLRKQLEQWFGRVINRRGRQLRESLTDVDAALTRIISLDAFCNDVLNALVGSARVTNATLYLWDEERRAYRVHAERGERAEPPVLYVSRRPFTDGFTAGSRAYVRAALAGPAAREPHGADAVRLALLDAMGADVVVPFRTDEVVLGWLGLRDEDDVEAFTEDEIGRLVATAARASIILENLQGFEKLKEEHRLAALGTMAAGLAHEIRNPLAGIKGAAQYLQGSRSGSDADMVNVIVDEVDRLANVVTQFLDYARPFALHMEPTDVRRIVLRVRQVIEAQGACADVDLVEEHAESLPEVPADAQRLHQVLLNLCQNGLQAMKSEGTLTVRTRLGRLRAPTARDAPAVEIAVEDTGIGIAAEDVDKLFVPFYTTRHDGTGLGLAICRRIVQSHGGELDVRSTVGEGSVFTVRLPLTTPAGITTAAPAATADVLAAG
jgi:signal transduction histidine kinase